MNDPYQVLGVSRSASDEEIKAAYRKLAQEHTVWVFERRNDMPAACSVRDMAMDAARAIRALDLGAVNLFGASQGGMMAMIIAAECPELVRRLAVGSTSARISDARYARVFEPWARLARAGDAAALYLSFGEAIYPRRMFDTIKPLLMDAAKAVTEEDLARFIAQTEALRGFDIQDDLRRVACPTLVIGDADDAVVGGAASEEIAARVKNAALYMYRGYGHAAYDLARDYKARLREFLAGRDD